MMRKTNLFFWKWCAVGSGYWGSVPLLLIRPQSKRTARAAKTNPATSRHLVRSSKAPPATASTTPQRVERKDGKASQTAPSRIADLNKTDAVSVWPCHHVTAAATPRHSTPTANRRRRPRSEPADTLLIVNKLAALSPTPP